MLEVQHRKGSVAYNVSAARRGCHTMKHDLEYWQPMSEGLRYIPACVQATYEPASTACTGSSQRLATSATREV